MKTNLKPTFSCSFCSSKNMELVMDFGEVALAGAFIKNKEFDNERKYPMRVCFCKDCFAVQVVDIIEPDILFKDYFYFSSSIKTLSNHFVNYAKEVAERFLNPKEANVLEFGCNDGVLLRPLADQGIKKVIGVDPAKNIISSISDERITIVNDYFTENVSKEIVAKYGSVDLIMANNVFAHISDIKGTTTAIKNALSDEGVYLVNLVVTVTVKNDNKTAFLVEVKQSGIFTIQGMAADQLGHVVGAYCPTILFPYAREVIGSLVARGGFPELLLAPVNFDALYMHSQQQKDQAKK